MDNLEILLYLDICPKKNEWQKEMNQFMFNVLCEKYKRLAKLRDRMKLLKEDKND